MNTAYKSEVIDFIASISNSARKSTEERIQHWISVLTNPERFYPDADPKALTIRLRQARQNLKRLLITYREQHGIDYLPLAKEWHKTEVIEAPLVLASISEVSQ